MNTNIETKEFQFITVLDRYQNLYNRDIFIIGITTKRKISNSVKCYSLLRFKLDHFHNVKIRLDKSEKCIVFVHKPNYVRHLFLKSSKTSSPNTVPFFSDRMLKTRPFQHLSSPDILARMVVTKLCTYRFFVLNSDRFLRGASKILGKKAADFYIQQTAGKMFSAGSDPVQLRQTITELMDLGMYPIVDYCAEGIETEAELNEVGKNLENVKLGIEAAAINKMCASAMKTSAFTHKQCLYNLNAKTIAQDKSILYDSSSLTPKEKDDLDSIVNHVRDIVLHGQNHGQTIMIDAEQSYFQPIIDEITLELQREFNQDQAFLLGTIQSYTKQSPMIVHQFTDFARRNNIKCGIKLVRGAYINEESEIESGVVHTTKQDSDDCFNTNAFAIFDQMQPGDKTIIATHNSESIDLACEMMQRLSMDKSSCGVSFGQLMGMGDLKSFQLIKKNYVVQKYLPWGPTEKMIPYLSRRAVENFGLVSELEKNLDTLREELSFRAEESGKRIAN